MLVAGALLLGIHGILFYACLPRRLPSAADWSAAAAHLAREGRAGDAVVLDPWWAERARQVLPGWLAIVALPRVREDDLGSARRAWLLALPRAPGRRSDVPGDLAARAVAIDPPRSFGRIELTLHHLRAPIVPPP